MVAALAGDLLASLPRARFRERSAAIPGYGLLGALLFSLPLAPAAAVDHEVRLLLDLDNDASTGCLVNTVDGPFDGVEQALISTVETSSPPAAGTVTDAAVSECVDEATDTFGAPASFDGGWPVGVDNGVDTRDLVETYVPRVLLAIPDPSVVRLGVVVTDELGSEEALLTVDGAPGGAPILLAVGTNSAPTAMEDEYETDVNTQLVVDAPGVLANDDDADPGDTLSAVLDADVTNGTLTLSSDGSFTYEPAPDFAGTDSFTYHASDGTDSSSTVTTTILVGPPGGNSAPTATDDEYETGKDTQLAVDAPGVLANDDDADSDDVLTAVLDTDVSDGTLALDPNGSFTYTPDSDFTGSDSFTYHANDGTADSAPANVTITVGAEPVPALGTWGLLLLAAFLVAGSLTLLRRGRSVTSGAILLMLAAGVAGAAGTLDGLPDDWSASDQLASDGLVLFGKVTADRLFFRVDVDLLFGSPLTAEPDALTGPRPRMPDRALAAVQEEAPRAVADFKRRALARRRAGSGWRRPSR